MVKLNRYFQKAVKNAAFWCKKKIVVVRKRSNFAAFCYENKLLHSESSENRYFLVCKQIVAFRKQWKLLLSGTFWCANKSLHPAMFKQIVAFRKRSNMLLSGVQKDCCIQKVVKIAVFWCANKSLHSESSETCCFLVCKQIVASSNVQTNCCVQKAVKHAAFWCANKSFHSESSENLSFLANKLLHPESSQICCFLVCKQIVALRKQCNLLFSSVQTIRCIQKAVSIAVFWCANKIVALRKRWKLLALKSNKKLRKC